MTVTRWKKRQQGGVLAECGLALPFLAFTFLLLTDALKLSEHYISLTLVAREAVRVASTIEGLDNQLIVPTESPTQAELQQCYDSTMTTYQPPPTLRSVCAARVIAQHISGLSRSYNIPMTNNTMKVTINKDPVSRIVKAEIESEASGLSRLLRGASVTTQATGSYDA